MADNCMFGMPSYDLALWKKLKRIIFTLENHSN
jgi:hypothetical protein